MSVWLDGPIPGPLVDGDLCEAGVGHQCDRDATVIARNMHGTEVLLCDYHAERHGLIRTAVAS